MYSGRTYLTQLENLGNDDDKSDDDGSDDESVKIARKLEMGICDEEDLNLAEVWVLAERMIMPHLQNYVIERIIQIARRGVIQISIFSYIVENTAVESGLFRLAIHQFSREYRAEAFAKDFIDHPDWYPPKFMAQALKYLMVNLRDVDGRQEVSAADYMVLVDG